jgi:hypothetical protein
MCGEDKPVVAVFDPWLRSDCSLLPAFTTAQGFFICVAQHATILLNTTPMFNKNRSGAFLRYSLSGDASRCPSRPAFVVVTVVALLLLDIDTPSLPTLELFAAHAASLGSLLGTHRLFGKQN